MSPSPSAKDSANEDDPQPKDDMNTDELERLIAVVRVVKGHDDYQAAE
jgi:hypothetical protein